MIKYEKDSCKNDENVDTLRGFHVCHESKYLQQSFSTLGFVTLVCESSVFWLDTCHCCRLRLRLRSLRLRCLRLRFGFWLVARIHYGEAKR